MVPKILVFFIALSIFVLSIPASAHQTGRNNGIEITMHIEPNDAPTTTRTAGFKTYLSDTQNVFRGENCDCNYGIKSERGVTKFSMTVVSKETYSFANFGVDFAQPGVYSITYSGEPKANLDESKNFNPFNISFDFRVEAEEGNTIKDSIWMYYLAYILIITSIFYLVWVVIQIFIKQ